MLASTAWQCIVASLHTMERMPTMSCLVKYKSAVPTDLLAQKFCCVQPALQSATTSAPLRASARIVASMMVLQLFTGGALAKAML